MMNFHVSTELVCNYKLLECRLLNIAFCLHILLYDLHERNLVLLLLLFSHLYYYNLYQVGFHCILNVAAVLNYLLSPTMQMAEG